MGNSAKKRSRSQEASQSGQRQLHLAEFVRRNLFTFVISEGMKALDAMLEEDRNQLCGKAYQKGDVQEAKRWGHAEGRLVMGGQRVMVRKPRVRQQGKEVPLPSWEQFADEDPLNERTVEQMMVGVSTRNYGRSVEELPQELGAHSKSKSATSRRFVTKTEAQLREWLRRDLSSLNLRVLMIDGIQVSDCTVVVALGIDETGRKHPIGLWLGATENATLCDELLDNLIERGLDAMVPRAFVIDGSKALRKSIRSRFGRRALVQRCQEHKRRNVLSLLPKTLQRSTAATMRDAYRSRTKSTAKKRLLALASRLDGDHPDAASSLKEGLDETLSLKDLGLPDALERTLSTTNPIENLNGSLRRVTRNVKRWRDGAMIKRWLTAALLEAERGFRRLRGYKGMSLLVQALENAEHIDRIDEDRQAA